MKRKRVAIVGGGLAGLTSAIFSSQNENCEIFLIEKEKKLGGNSQKATSGINGVFSEFQMKEGVDDSYDIFFEDTIKSGKGKSNKKLVKILVEKSTSAISFLSSYGVDLSKLCQCGGHSKKRTHRCNPEKVKRNVGGEIVNRLIDGLRNIKINIILFSKVTEITRVGDTFLVDYVDLESGKNIKISANNLILTTGGFSSDSKGLISQIAPELAYHPTTNGECSKGEGIRLGLSLKAKVVDLKEIQIHPTGIIDPKDPGSEKVFLAPEAIRASGGLLLNTNGERFVNELAFRDDVTEKIEEQCGDKFRVNRPISYLVLNEKTVKTFGESTIGFYKFKGLVKEYNNADEFSRDERIEVRNIESTFEEYNNALKLGRDKFGKSLFPFKYSANEKLFVIYVTPSIHYTMGGIEINENAEVLDENGNVIPHFYAAGEVTGGVHGKNRLAGNSLLECVVFGRIAGENVASKY